MLRDSLKDYFKTLNLGTVSVSDELPYTKEGNPLYLSNFKKIYVDRDQITQDSVINTLGGGSIVNETRTVTAYLVVDAKVIITNLDTIVTQIRDSRNQIDYDDNLARTCTINQTFEGDALVTEWVFSFRKLLT